MSDVVDRTKAFKALYNTLLNPNNSKMLAVIQSGDESAAAQVLQLFGLDSKDKDNIQQVFDLSKMIKSEAQTKQEEQAAKNKADFERSKAREDYQKAVQDTMALDPKTRLLYNALIGVSEGARAMGNASRNNGKMGAQVALEGQRNHSAEQDRIYGPSIRDKANSMYAANSIRQGENGGAFWDALSNTLSKVLGMTQQNDLAVRQMKMIPYDKEMNMSGNYYQMMNQDRKRAFNVGRD